MALVDFIVNQSQHLWISEFKTYNMDIRLDNYSIESVLQIIFCHEKVSLSRKLKEHFKTHQLFFKFHVFDKTEQNSFLLKCSLCFIVCNQWACCGDINFCVFFSKVFLWLNCHYLSDLTVTRCVKLVLHAWRSQYVCLFKRKNVLFCILILLWNVFLFPHIVCKNW